MNTELRNKILNRYRESAEKENHARDLMTINGKQEKKWIVMYPSSF